MLALPTVYYIRSIHSSVLTALQIKMRNCSNDFFHFYFPRFFYCFSSRSQSFSPSLSPCFHHCVALLLLFNKANASLKTVIIRIYTARNYQPNTLYSNSFHKHSKYIMWTVCVEWRERIHFECGPVFFLLLVCRCCLHFGVGVCFMQFFYTLSVSNSPYIQYADRHYQYVTQHFLYLFLLLIIKIMKIILGKIIHWCQSLHNVWNVWNFISWKT